MTKIIRIRSDKDQSKPISNKTIRVGFAGTFAFVNLPSFVTRTDRFTSPGPCRLWSKNQSQHHETKITRHQYRQGEQPMLGGTWWYVLSQTSPIPNHCGVQQLRATAKQDHEEDECDQGLPPPETAPHQRQASKTTMKRTDGTKIPVQALIKEPRPTPCDKDHKASMPLQWQRSLERQMWNKHSILMLEQTFLISQQDLKNKSSLEHISRAKSKTNVSRAQVNRQGTNSVHGP